MDTKKTGSWSIDNILCVLLVLASVFSVWEAYANKQLRHDLDKTRETLGRAQVGDYVPTFDLATVQDPMREIKIGASEQGDQYVYFFSPSCPYCIASAPYVEKIYDNVKKANGKMYAVSFQGPDETKAYLQKVKTSMPTVSLASARDQALLRVRTVPAFAALDPAGRIKYIRYGKLSDQDIPTGPGAAMPDLSN